MVFMPWLAKKTARVVALNKGTTELRSTTEMARATNYQCNIFKTDLLHGRMKNGYPYKYEI
jgi:hypothetical protein